MSKQNSASGSRGTSPVREKTKLQTLAATHVALRGHLTRRITNAHMLCDLAEQIGTPTMSLLSDLKKAQESLREMFAKVELSSQDLMTLDRADKVDSWLTKLKEDEVHFRKQESELVTTIAECELRLLPKADSDKVVGANGQRTKANNALRPKVLIREMTPVEFASWITRFDAYYASSNMSNCTLPEQQAYFKACIDTYLEARIQDRISPATPILKTDGTVSCLDLLASEFLLLHPIFARRLDFFQAKQGHNQSFTDFAQKLIRLGDEAELASLDMNDLYVMRFLTACTNLKLRERFLKEINPSRDKLLQVAQNFEVSQRFISAINKSQGQVASNQVSQRKFTTQHKGKKPLNQNQRNVAKNRCRRCGSKTTGPHDCKGASATCYRCGKKGHLAPVCLSAPKSSNNSGSRAQSASSTPRSRSRRNSSSSGSGRNTAKTIQVKEEDPSSDEEVNSSLVAEYLH